MKIFPGMTLRQARRMNWVEANTLIACHNNDMRERRRMAEREQRRQQRKSKLRRLIRR